MKKIYLLLIVILGLAFNVQSQVVINEVYGGGGNSGSTYRQDFIELYNNGATAVDLSGWSVQYASAAGTTWAKTNLVGSIPANSYYLIQQSTGAGGTTNIPTPEVIGTIAMSATAGKIALVNNQVVLTGTCPTGAQIVDFVGFGLTANCFEGTGPTPAPSNTNSVQRIFSAGTAQDTQNNSADFTAGLPSPTNASGGADVTPPTITTLSPANGATNVGVSITATVTFNETVTKGASGTITVKRLSDDVVIQSFDITTAAVTVAGNNVSFNINVLSFNTAYYIEITAAAFKDLANNNFAGITGNSTWNFTTAAGAPVGVVGTTYSFATCSGTIPDGFTQYSVIGDQVWACTTFGHDPANPTASAPNGVQINGFSGGTNVPNQDWFISPAYDLTATTFPLLSFWSRTAFNGLPLKLKVSTDYISGDPTLATWTDINGKFPNQASNIWTLSANINLSVYKTTNVRFAFVYFSSIDDGARWTLDDILVQNSLTAPPPSMSVSATDIQFGFVATPSSSVKTFTFTGNDLIGGVTATATGSFTLSKDNVSFSPAISYTQAEANNVTSTVYVRFMPPVNGQDFTGSVTISTTGVADTIVTLKGTSIDPVNTLEVVNWNIEWFGSTTFGPTNDAQQEANVTTILNNIGADIYGLLEVVSEPRLISVVSQMPGYAYVLSNYGSHTNTSVNPPSALAEAQKLAFIYKTSIFSNVTAAPLLSQGINSAADISNPAYNYWASGRFPYMMTADVTLNGITKTVRFVLIHGKANTSPTATSYARRKAGSDTLQYTLNTLFPNDNIILLGDFNDDLDQSITAGFTTTSYSAFTTDNTHFYSPTLPLSLAGKKSTISYNDVIDHVMLSNEMQCNYMSATANILTDVTSLVVNYGTTTTDHYPVFTRYAFTPGPAATITYAGSPYCQNAGTSAIIFTGTTGGTYSSTTGLTINGTTGNITLATSTAGTYVVTYTIAATACELLYTTTTTVTITATPVATISYSGSPYCQNAGTTTVTRTGTAGGTYSSSTGLSIDPSTGTVTLGTSTAGTYTVTYTVAAAGGCTAITPTTTITISSVSIAPTGATASAMALCGAGIVNLSVQAAAGSLGTGATWKWYTGSCGGTLVGTGATLSNVAITGTTTYYVRAEGTCNTTSCASVTVTVNTQPSVTLSAAPYTSLIPGLTTILTATVTPPSATNTLVWYRNGIAVPGATASTLNASVDELGSYYVRITTINNCTAISNTLIIRDSVTDKLFITPNPNNGLFQVRYTSVNGTTTLRMLTVYDNKGARVYSKTFSVIRPYNSMNVDMRNQGRGLYFIVVSDANGNKLTEGKVIVL